MHEVLWQGFEARRFIGILFVALPELQFLDEVLLRRGVLLCLVSALVLIVGADHGGSFAPGSLLRIVAACPGNWSRHESLGSFGVKRMSGSGGFLASQL